MADERTIILIREDQSNIAELILFAVESNINHRGIICNDQSAIMDWLKQPAVQGVIATITPKNKDDIVAIQRALTSRSYPSILVVLEESGDLGWCETEVPPPDATIKRSHCLEELSSIFQQNFEKKDSTALEQYTRISMSPLTYFKNLAEDVFIRLNSGRFLKLFREGDHITAQDIQKYQQKGLQELYLEREAYSWILKKVNEKLPELINEPDTKLDMEEIKSEEYSPAPIEGPVQLQQEFLDYLHTKSEQMVKGMMKTKGLAKFFKNLTIDNKDSEYLNNRISIASNIACGIIQQLEWGQEATYEKLLYAIHTHDISLMPTPELMKFRTLAELEMNGNISEELKEQFLSHPERSVEIVNEDPFAPSDVESIIMQHHELPKGEGFPKQLPSSKIQPMAIILIVSIDLAESIIRSRSKQPLEFVPKLRERYNSSGFVKVIKTLEELLDPSAARRM